MKPIRQTGLPKGLKTTCMVAPELNQRIQAVLVHAQSTDAEEEAKILNLNASSATDDADGLVEVPAKIQVRARGERLVKILN